MNNKLSLKIIEPDNVKVEGDFDHVIVPGVDGDFGVAAAHTPFITKIRPGILQLFNGKTSQKYAIHDGFVTVEKDTITILTETVEKTEEIDAARAKKSKDRAEKRLTSSQEDVNFRRAEASLKRALVRLQLSKRK